VDYRKPPAPISAKFDHMAIRRTIRDDPAVDGERNAGLLSLSLSLSLSQIHTGLGKQKRKDAKSGRMKISACAGTSAVTLFRLAGRTTGEKWFSKVLGPTLDRCRTLVNPIAWCKRAERGPRKVEEILSASQRLALGVTLSSMFPIFRGIYASGHLEMPPCSMKRKRERERGRFSRNSALRKLHSRDTDARNAQCISLNYSP